MTLTLPIAISRRRQAGGGFYGPGGTCDPGSHLSIDSGAATLADAANPGPDRAHPYRHMIPTLRGDPALSTGCNPCSARVSHAAWETDRRYAVARAGIEPATFRFSGERCYQLSYLAKGVWSDPDGTRTRDLRRDRAAR